MIFLLNFIFWLFGGLMISIGFYAFYEKYQATGWVKVETIYDIVLNISLVMKTNSWIDLFKTNIL